MMRLACTLVLSLSFATLSMLCGRAAMAAPPTQTAAVGGVVNLNTAGEAELTLLPGVGPAKAKAILDWRQKHGSFKKVDDLTKVKGFGRKTFLRLKPHLSVNGQTTYRGPKLTHSPDLITPPTLERP